MDDTERMQRRAEQNSESARQQLWQRKPANLFADQVAFFDDDAGTVQIVFSCSRPEMREWVGDSAVVVARVTMAWPRLKPLLDAFQRNMAMDDTIPD